MSALPSYSPRPEPPMRRHPRTRSQIPATATAIRASRIGDLRWFAENLRYRTADSQCYENDEANSEGPRPTLPPGGRAEGVPRRMAGSERRGLARAGAVGGDIGSRDREGRRPGRACRPPPQVRRRHRLQRVVLGLGRPHLADSSRAMGRNAAYWASTPGPPDDVSATAWHRDVAANRNSIWRSPVNVTYWLSVRCVHEP
jgi:hypothetical protein